VRIVDKSAEIGEIAKELDVRFLNTDVLNEGMIKEEIVDTDVLLISVPIDITERVIERVGPEMCEGSLLMDITSVKRMPVETMERCTNVGVEILGTHPLFGPSTKSCKVKQSYSCRQEPVRYTKEYMRCLREQERRSNY
jgi:prephenate dehydrogenase